MTQRDSQASERREELSVLYEAVHRGDPSALSVFLPLAARELRRWLDRRYRELGAALDTREIAADALAEVCLRAARIQGWTYAWAYACRVATRRVARRVRELMRSRRPRQTPGVSGDPEPGRFHDEVELDEAIETLLTELSDSQREFLYVTLCARNLSDAAEALNISVRTVKRQRRLLLQTILRVLGGTE